ncbi:MAG: MFS transporter [Prolixibacteraceae bacterium]
MQNQTNKAGEKKFRKWLIIFSLVAAGELIFGLPFHLARFFRPAILGVFDLTNAELGDAIAVYGIIAMLSYFPGGLIADRFSARKLMSISLFATALGGVWLTTIPDKSMLSVLFGYWGATTILLFWSALIRATREWGGKYAQGRAFGFLDGGRGLVAAGAASLGVVLFSSFLPADFENVSRESRIEAFRVIIWFYTLLTFGGAVLVWIFIPDTEAEKLNPQPFKGIKNVLRSSVTWLIAIVIITAYCGYKGLDFYGLYAMKIMDMNEVSAARFVSNASYLRVIGAIGAGILADRISAKRTVFFTFALLIPVYLLLAFLTPGASLLPVITGNLLFTFLSVYALRGVYFALLEESDVPKSITGTTVGVVSLLGFTPDVFFNSLAGRMLDATFGIAGFHHFFLLLTGFSAAGLGAVVMLMLQTGKRKSAAGNN